MRNTSDAEASTKTSCHTQERHTQNKTRTLSDPNSWHFNAHVGGRCFSNSSVAGGAHRRRRTMTEGGSTEKNRCNGCVIHFGLRVVRPALWSKSRFVYRYNLHCFISRYFSRVVDYIARTSQICTFAQLKQLVIGGHGFITGDTKHTFN